MGFPPINGGGGSGIQFGSNTGTDLLINTTAGSIDLDPTGFDVNLEPSGGGGVNVEPTAGIVTIGGGGDVDIAPTGDIIATPTGSIVLQTSLGGGITLESDGGTILIKTPNGDSIDLHSFGGVAVLEATGGGGGTIIGTDEAGLGNAIANSPTDPLGFFGKGPQTQQAVGGLLTPTTLAQLRAVVDDLINALSDQGNGIGLVADQRV